MIEKALTELADALALAGGSKAKMLEIQVSTDAYRAVAAELFRGRQYAPVDWIDLTAGDSVVRIVRA
jgi:hypothetical protein